ncbi:MAG: hypothetical protein DSY42_02680 [Aquifex sp.]|nr:MAG: hypothetical protein DSY42_02680 [Aquifex sp.]
MEEEKTLPIILGTDPEKTIRIDKLPTLSGEFSVHIHTSENEKNAHIKLEYGDTPYCLSLYVFNYPKFLRNETVRVRNYDLWDKWIMFAAKLPNGKPHPKSGGKIYREDAIIVGEGTYNLENPFISFSFKDGLILNFRIEFYRYLRYHSPKYGKSFRSEYWFIGID